MAKKAKSKMNRKTKRIIRRCIAGLLMVTAIGIAAIPAKETEAADNAAAQAKRTKIAANAVADTTNYNTSVSYSSGNATDLSLSNAAQLAATVNSEGTEATVGGTTYQLYPTYTISNLSSGKPEIKWQFKYYAITGLGGIIAKYNDEYKVNNVTLPNNGVRTYAIVSESMYNNFYIAGDGAATYTLQYTDYYSTNAADSSYITTGHKNPNTEMFEKYFSSYFTPFWALCEKYYKYEKEDYPKWQSDMVAYNGRKTTWEAANPGGDYSTQETPPGAPEVVTMPTPISVVPKDAFANATNADTLRKQFYCDKVFSNFGSGFNLVKINDRVGYYEGYTSTGSGSSITYTKVPAELQTVQGIEMPKTGAAMSDSVIHEVYAVSTSGANVVNGTDVDGYLALETSPNINGIANKAFEGVANVDVLTLPSETKYIGDEAFKNSFIKEINLTNVENIGNRAFLGCSQLATVNMGNGTKIIGTDAFYQSAIKSIKIPVSVNIIGPGAFAECNNLATADLSELETGSCDIADFAFYNDIRINSVVFPDRGITHLGKGCFAVSSTVSGSWTNIKLPDSITKRITKQASQYYSDSLTPSTEAEGLGNFLFAGRYNIEKVTMPADYGLSANSDNEYTIDADYKLTDSYNVMPAGMFKGCSSLSCIEFPETSAYPKFHPYMFLDVTNKDFYIRGPEKKSDGKAALPRQSTWQAITQASDFVPYIYKDSTGTDQYEVSDGTYLLTASPDGTLTNCTLVNPAADNLDMVIPSTVGGYQVKTIASDCFDDTTKSKIKTLTIEDDSVTSISPDAFSNMEKLETLTIGNSVTDIGSKAFYNCDALKHVYIGNGTKTIGDSAFEDCKLLEDAKIGNAITSVGNKVFYNCPAMTLIAFASPKGGYDSLTVGTDAFTTKGTKLTLEGDIHGGYALFDWATDKDNTIDDLGTRVYYRSPYPSALGVLYDNNTNEITLVDYPKFNALDTDHLENNKKMQLYYYDLYSDAAYNELRTKFDTAWAAASTDAEKEAVYADKTVYGPWVYDNGALSSNGRYVPAGDAESNATGASNPNPYAYFEKHPYSIIDNYNNSDPAGDYETPTLEEQSWIDATLNVVVPEGVTSIDIYDFIKGSSKNQQNVQKYLKSLPGYNMYISDQVDTSTDPTVTSVPGLFSGYYTDYGTSDPAKAKYEKATRGNDCIESITLNSVKSLPNYCFDSCEKLKTVNIGPDCEDIGNAPFRGCNNLSVVGGNDNFKYDNGIIYSVNDDGTYTIEECLSSRGNVIGTSLINGNNDKNLANVSTIKEGAFEECDTISNVDLSTAEKLTEIPETAFRNCDMLSFVTLPESVNSIKSDAFAGDTPISVTIPGTEVAIATSAFEHSPTVNIRTYEDSAALEYAKYHKLSYEIIDEKFRVLFYDYDGTQLGEAQYIESGKSATPPADPSHEGMTFTGWSDSYNNVQKDLILIAQYSGGGSVSGGDSGGGSGSGGSGGGSGSGGSSSGGSGSGGSSSGGSGDSTGSIFRVTVVNGSGTGDYLAGRTVTITANTGNGKTFSNWSSNDGVAFANSTSATTTFTMPSKNVTVTAYYTTSGSGGDGTTGANKTNTAGNLGTRVAIYKPGISNTNVASAKVNGSSDDFIVKISETADATQAVEQALINEYGSLDNIKYFAMDITLWDSTGATKITDTTGLSVDITIPLPDSLKDYGGNNKTAAVVNSQLESLTPKFTTIDGVPCVTFRATHFSPYAVFVDTGDLSAGTRPDGTPKTADGIHPKWFLSIGLAALALVLFFKKDKVQIKNI